MIHNLTCAEASALYDIEIDSMMSARTVLDLIPDDCFHTSLCPSDILEAAENEGVEPSELEVHRIMPQSVFVAFLK